MPSRSWEDLGIVTRGASTGHIKTRCPGVDGNGCSKNQAKKDLSVNLDTGAYLCHNPGCEFKGFLNGGSRPAAPSIDERVYRKISPEDWQASTKPLPPEARAYLHKRGFSDQTIDYFGLRWGTITKIENRWVHGIFIPYPSKDPSERAWVNIKKRPLDKDDPMGMAGAEKETKLPAELIFYNIRNCLKAGRTAVVTEGEYDVLALKEAGIDYAMSVPNGVPSDDPEKIRNATLEYLATCQSQLAELDHIILFGDDDKPGRALQGELARRVGREKCSFVTYPEGCKDANDVLLKHGPEKLRELIERATPYPVSGLGRPKDLLSEVLTWKKDGMPRGLSTGWPEIDAFWRPTDGQMTIVTGVPSMGKSEFLDALLINLYRLHGWRAVIFSPESFPSSTHVVKLLEKWVGKPFDDGVARMWQLNRYPDITAMTEQEVRDGVDDLESAVSFIMPDLDGDGITLDRILEYTRAEIARRGVKVLVIDPWNEIEHLIPQGMREDQYVSRALSKIRRFARRHGIHIFVVAHPTKMQKQPEEINGEKVWVYPIPTLYDVSGGAHWYNKADNGIAVWRDFHAEAKGTDPNLNTIKFEKVKLKWTGTKGSGQLQWDPPTGRYLSPGDDAPSSGKPARSAPPPEAQTSDDDQELLF